MGEVHITHKTKPPYNHWSIVQQAVATSGLTCTGSVIVTSTHTHSLSLFWECEMRQFTPGPCDFLLKTREGVRAV